MLGVCEEWEPSLSGPIVSVLNEMFSKAEKELSGVWSSATNALSLYRDPVVQGVVSQSDFCLDDIANGETPVSLYLVVPPSDLSRTKPLIRLILNQLGKRLAEKLNKKHSVLMLLDEFPTLGRLDFFETALSYLAGYKVRCLLITQSLAQLDNVYGRNNSVMANCSTRICFAPNDIKTAQTIARLLGEATVRIERGKNRENQGAETLSYSDQYVKRYLLTPGEVMQMSPEQELIFTSSTPPIRAEKIRYYAEERFRDVWQ
jgi:type IV secretion system protein VirD4